MKRLQTGFSKYFNSSFFLINRRRSSSEHETVDMFFSELESCNIYDPPKASESWGRNSTDQDPEISQKDLPKIKSEEAGNEQFEQTAKDLEQEIEILEREKNSRVRRKMLESYLPSFPAKSYLTSAELTAEGSPQYLISSSVEKLKSLPRLRSQASAAVTSLVGHVSKIQSPSCSKKERLPFMSEDITSCDFYINYEIALFGEMVASSVLVRCYGVKFCTFVEKNMSDGDIIHVLGQLAPNLALHPSSFMVCVFSPGGNITVVARHNV